jgi:hypothetical protein
MNTAEIILLVLLAINILCAAILHDKPKQGKYNVLEALVQAGFTFGLLYWAGLFH